MTTTGETDNLGDVIRTESDHASLDVVLDRPKAFRELREQCPVVHSSAYGGF